MPDTRFTRFVITPALWLCVVLFSVNTFQLWLQRNMMKDTLRAASTMLERAERNYEHIQIFLETSEKEHQFQEKWKQEEAAEWTKVHELLEDLQRGKNND
jgi:hypothetical protein